MFKALCCILVLIAGCFYWPIWLLLITALIDITPSRRRDRIIVIDQHGRARPQRRPLFGR